MPDLQKLTQEEGEAITNTFTYLRKDFPVCKWEYIRFDVKHKKGFSYDRKEYAINRELKVYRFMDIGEAYNVGIKID